jgi:hypothetical protein
MTYEWREEKNKKKKRGNKIKKNFKKREKEKSIYTCWARLGGSFGGWR